jgi:hypothetical protein
MKKKMKKQFIITYVVGVIVLISIGTLLLGASIADAESVKYKQVGYIGGPLLYLFSIYLIYVIKTKDCFKVIKQYVIDYPDITMEDLENDFSKAEAMGKRVWVGQRWTFYMNELSFPDVIEHEKIVWAHFYREHYGKNSNGYIYTYNAKKNLVKIPIASRNAKKALKVYSEKMGILVGYSKEYRKMYEEDFEGFLSLRYTNS